MAQISVTRGSTTAWCQASSPCRRVPHHMVARRSRVVSSAYAGEEKVVYKGMYGDWSVEEEDVREVLSYRAGLNVAAAALVAGSAAALLPSGDGLLGDLRSTLLANLDPICFVGAGALGASLFLIHIYVATLKRAVQLFWATGLAGMVYIATTQGSPSIAEYVVQHREAVWLVGPLFAALTGVAFKEGMCYGKPEAAVLFFLTPALLGGHLLGFVPDSVERVLLGAVAATVTVFAARKWTQPIKDDIGDKSVFMHIAAVERGEVDDTRMD